MKKNCFFLLCLVFHEFSSCLFFFVFSFFLFNLRTHPQILCHMSSKFHEHSCLHVFISLQKSGQFVFKSTVKHLVTSLRFLENVPKSHKIPLPNAKYTFLGATLKKCNFFKKQISRESRGQCQKVYNFLGRTVYFS